MEPGRPKAVCGSRFACVLIHPLDLAQASAVTCSLLQGCSWDQLREPPLVVKFVVPTLFPYPGSKPQMPWESQVAGEGTPSVGCQGAVMSCRVALCPQWWLPLNSSHCTWEEEGPVTRPPQPPNSVREARNPDVCENPWFLNVIIKSKSK